MAANGVTVVAFGFLLYGSIVDSPLLLAVFLVTFAVYGLNKLTDKAEDSINRPEHVPKALNYYPIFMIVSICVGFLISIVESVLACIILLTPLLIGFVYSIKLTKAIPRLKEVLGVKSVAVASSWALTGAFLPNPIIRLDTTIVFFIYIFLKVFVGTVLCDVLDMKGDCIAGIETIPIRLKKNKTKNLLVFLNSIGILLLIYCNSIGILVSFIPALLFGILYGYAAIWYFFRRSCKRETATFMLDAEWLPIIIVAFFLAK